MDWFCHLKTSHRKNTKNNPWAIMQCVLPLPSLRGLKKTAWKQADNNSQMERDSSWNQMSHLGLIQRSTSLLFFMLKFSTSGWVIHSFLSLMTTHNQKVLIDHFAIYFFRCNSFGPMIILCFHGSIKGISRSGAVMGKTNKTLWVT